MIRILRGSHLSHNNNNNSNNKKPMWRSPPQPSLARSQPHCGQFPWVAIKINNNTCCHRSKHLNLCFTDWYCYYDRENYSFEAFHISFFVSSFALPVIFNTILNVINVHHHSSDIYKSCSKSIHMIDPILAWKHSDDSSIDQLMTSRKDSGLSIDWHTRIQWMYFSEHYKSLSHNLLSWARLTPWLTQWTTLSLTKIVMLGPFRILAMFDRPCNWLLKGRGS